MFSAPFLCFSYERFALILVAQAILLASSGKGKTATSLHPNKQKTATHRPQLSLDAEHFFPHIHRGTTLLHSVPILLHSIIKQFYLNLLSRVELRRHPFTYQLFYMNQGERRVNFESTITIFALSTNETNNLTFGCGASPGTKRNPILYSVQLTAIILEVVLQVD
jgi:hypothetical protein